MEKRNKNNQFVLLPKSFSANLIEDKRFDPYLLYMYVSLRIFMKNNNTNIKVGLKKLSKMSGMGINTISSKLELLRRLNIINYTTEKNKTTIYKLDTEFDNKFKMISFDMLNNDDLTTREKAYLVALSYYIIHNEDNFYCSLSPTQLSKKIGMSLSTIKEIQKSLKNKGLLTTERFGGLTEREHRVWIYYVPILFIPPKKEINYDDRLEKLEMKYLELEERINNLI